jgi:hypothetical protein
MPKSVVQKWGAAASWRCGKAAAALAREKKDDVLKMHKLASNAGCLMRRNAG